MDISQSTLIRVLSSLCNKIKLPVKKERNQSSLLVWTILILWLLSFGLAFAESCAVEMAELQPIADAHNQAHTEEYARCIACCGGIASHIVTNMCGSMPVANHTVTDGKQAWIEGVFCNALVTGEPCVSYQLEHRQCTLEEGKQDRDCSKSNPVAGDPIIVATGNSFQTEVDYQSHTPFGLSFIRYYNSSAPNSATDIGVKWNHNYSNSITHSDTDALISRNNGQAFMFTFDDTVWVGDVDVPDTLVETVDGNDIRTGWVYTDSNDTVETYNAIGQLLSITNRAGQSQIFSYDVTAIEGGDDNDDTLDKVTGFSGEVMIFTYVAEFTSPKRIARITDPEGNEYNYSYDAAGHLTNVTYSDSTPLDSLDNPIRTYHYENTSFPSHLTGLTDETGSRVTWAFDEQGRAISSELQDGVDKSTLDFSVTDQVTVTNPLGKDTTYHFTKLHGVKKVTQVEGHATESCSGANQNYTYDANGYIESKTDWQGNVITYIHNERGLETSRTEASGTDEARTITTQWHNEFRLPVKITEPGQVTDFIYDANGRLISKAVHKLP